MVQTPPSSDSIIASRRFTMEDQHMFARASSDTNPMHMDPVAARRTQAGAPVVHGIHVTLWVLDELEKAGLPIARLSALKVQFSKFVFIDRQLTIRLVKVAEGSARAEVRGDDLSLLNLTLTFGPRPTAPESKLNLSADETQVTERAAELQFADMAERSGWLTPPAGNGELSLAYPALAEAIGRARVSALAQTSTLVGMVCPGLYSVYSALSVQFVEDQDKRSGIGFRVTGVDERFSMATMAIAGSGIVGEVTAFLRQAPSEAPTISQLRERVSGEEFAGVSALIVGGSRGLGAVTASLIAAGGGKVCLTYAQGRDISQGLSDRINAACDGEPARILPLDVRHEIEDQLKGLDQEITHVYYFATPQIFRQKAALYSNDVFDEFYKFYVSGFYSICRSLVVRPRTGKLTVYYPSSEAVSDRPKGLSEYAMAKAAGELLCVDMDRHMPGIRVHWTRIPRTETDQTATVSGASAEDPVDVMLPIIRALASAT